MAGQVVWCCAAASGSRTAAGSKWKPHCGLQIVQLGFGILHEAGGQRRGTGAVGGHSIDRAAVAAPLHALQRLKDVIDKTDIAARGTIVAQGIGRVRRAQAARGVRVGIKQTQLLKAAARRRLEAQIAAEIVRIAQIERAQRAVQIET